MGKGTQYRNKTFRNPWSGHRITYSSSSTCFGLGILYPSWSKLTIFLPSIRGYGEPPKKEKVTSCYNTLLQGMSSPKICCCRCCCFYSKWKELSVSGCKNNKFTHPPLYLPHLDTMGTKSCRQCKSWCKYLLWEGDSIKLSANFGTVARDTCLPRRQTLQSEDNLKRLLN